MRRNSLAAAALLAAAITSIGLTGPAASAASISASAGPTSQQFAAPDDGIPHGSATYTNGQDQTGSTATVAPDSTNSPAATWVCTVYADNPSLSGYIISGSASQICSGTGFAAERVSGYLQRLRWYGWEDMDSESGSWGSANISEVYLEYDCEGDGEYTFRVLSVGEANGGLYTASAQSATQLRVVGCDA